MRPTTRPITNAYAPGELVNLYGNFGVSSQVDTVLPIPTTLNGVQVFVNGLAAPVYAVRFRTRSALGFLTRFRVTISPRSRWSVNGSKSNNVTVYVDNSAPGIYTLPETGLGPGAILHADYSLVNG
jgi:uncharacterized protein (TIGR03437 family)